MDAELTDQEIAARVLAGDMQAYARLVDRHQGALLGLAVHLLGDPAQAEDAIQNVFIEAYKHLDRYDGQREFSYWLKGIARNLIKQELRTRTRYSDRLRRYHEELLTRMQDDPSAARRRSAVKSALAHCMHALPEDAREAIRLRFEEAQSCEDVAEGIGRGVQATYQLLYRVRLQLRDCVEDRLDHEPA